MADQNKYKTIALLLLVAVLIIGEIAIVFRGNINIKPKSEYIQGIAKAEYKLVSYKPVVKVIGNLTEDERLALKNISDIDEINGTTILFLKDPYDIEKVKSIVKDKDIFAKAEFSPAGLALLNGQTFNISLPFSFYIKPDLPVNATVEFEFEAIGQNGVIVATGSPKFTYYQKQLSVEGTVVNTTNEMYLYIVDFENRSLVKEFNGTVNNVVKNIVPKKVDYATYIGEDYIIVNESVNKTTILKDFPDAVFEDSYIYSKAPLNISFAKKLEKVKKCHIKLHSYFDLAKDEIEESCEKDIGDKVNVTINALISGNTILDFNIIKIV